MATNTTGLLQQLHAYVDTYIAYLGHGPGAHMDQANSDMQRVIHELEDIQAHPDQAGEAERAMKRISALLDHLRFQHQQAPHPHRASVQQESLARAFRSYLDDEISYISHTGRSVWRDQTNLLLGDVIADLKALALNPTDEQAARLTQDLEQKRAELARVQRPWQQSSPQEASEQHTP
ncbi:MAG: hypothetical protein H0X37_26335 [Herpetosiphonaceae bacterium]|nr:hypothetical protein [Herpetosiphonaceae bacterium]